MLNRHRRRARHSFGTRVAVAVAHPATRIGCRICEVIGGVLLTLAIAAWWGANPSDPLAPDRALAFAFVIAGFVTLGTGEFGAVFGREFARHFPYAERARRRSRR